MAGCVSCNQNCRRLGPEQNLSHSLKFLENLTSRFRGGRILMKVHGLEVCHVKRLTD